MAYLNGASIKQIREQRGLTQRELADRLFVSDKTVSKWETGRGLPAVEILPELAAALSVSVAELLAGAAVSNRNRAGNLKRTLFYVCPVCGNVIASVGESVVSCCGVPLAACEPEPCDEEHAMQVSIVDDERYVELDHPMEKTHYITFLACCTDDRVQLVKLYPEQSASARFLRRGHGILYACCNRHGLFQIRA